VFLRAFQGLHRLRDPRAFRSWLLGIAHNRTLEHLRERLRLRILDDTALELLFEGSQLAILEGDDDDARRTIELESLQECLRRLPSAGARLVRDHYFKGRPIAYLAAQAGKNEGAVRVMLFRLRETLRDCVRARAAGRGQK
jgi:RNA polymerase sigma-70 factor, ECF subfamily